MISFSSSGSFSRTQAFLKALAKNQEIMTILTRGGLRCVMALRLATPIESGRAASSWDFQVEKKKTTYSLTITNSDLENGFPVAIMLQYGHGTGSGGYVEGRDYINPAIQPIFDQLAEEVWEAVIAA